MSQLALDEATFARISVVLRLVVLGGMIVALIASLFFRQVPALLIIVGGAAIGALFAMVARRTHLI